MTQFVVIVQILVSERDADNALHHQRLYRVLDKLLVAGIVKAGSETPHHANHTLRGTQEQGASIRRDRPAIERGRHLVAFNRWKRK